MDFNLTEEQQMLRDGAERYVREVYEPNARRKMLHEKKPFSRERWEQYAELGWLGISLPEDVGGLACSFVETAIILEAFGRGLVLEPYVPSAVLGARIVDRSGSEAHRQELLPALIEGKLLLAVGHGEPGSRFDRKTVKTTAKLSGGGFVLDGVKQLVCGAQTADRLIVSATVDGGKDFALFAVDAKAAGISRFDYDLIDGTQAADVTFKGVQLPASALLVPAGQAYEVLDEALDYATLAATAEALGVMESVLTITSEYIKTRQQFGQPIGKFQALQHRMSEMFVETQQTRSILYRGMAHMDAAPDERRKAISATKIVAGDAARFVGGNGIQLHGGYGMTEEYQVSHLFKKLITFEKMFGDTDWHLARFANS